MTQKTKEPETTHEALGIPDDREKELEKTCKGVWEDLPDTFTQPEMILSVQEAMEQIAATPLEQAYAHFQMGEKMGFLRGIKRARGKDER